MATTMDDARKALARIIEHGTDDQLEAVRQACIKDGIQGGVHLAVVLEQHRRQMEPAAPKPAKASRKRKAS